MSRQQGRLPCRLWLRKGFCFPARRLLHRERHVAQHKVHVYARDTQVLQQLGREDAVAPSSVRCRLAGLAGKGYHGARAHVHLCQAAPDVAGAARHGAGLAAAGVQEQEVQVATAAVDALQHVLHAQRFVVQQRVVLNLLHGDQVVLLVGLDAVACRSHEQRVPLGRALSDAVESAAAYAHRRRRRARRRPS